MKNGFISDEDIYNLGLAKQDSTEPTINNLPNPIIINNSNVVTTIEDTYVVYGMLGGTSEYIAFDTKFTSMKEIAYYVIANNKYEEIEVIINANGNNGRTVTSTQMIKFINDNTEPTINNLPTPVIISGSTVITTIEETYETYGEAGGTSEYIVFDTKFNSMKEVVNYVIENSRYETVDIVINANGNNGMTATSTQNVQFINDSAAPVINTLPTPIFTNVTQVESSYVTYGETGGAETYTIVAVNETFNTMPEVVEYAYNWMITNNQNEVTVDIQIIAKGNNNINTESTQPITFKKPLEPDIRTLTTPIITNITPVESSYVTYDDLGAKEETYTIVAVNETFNTMTEVVAYADKWLLDNKQYEVEVDVKVIAKGNSNLSSESTQTLKFIRGVKVTNETEFSNALASTSPSYIQVANNIACSSTISADGVTHKLDLNNCTVSKTVTNESFTFITLGSSTNLTILDSSSSKQGNILAKLYEETNSDGDNRETDITCIKNNGILTIESGTVSADSVQKMLAAKKNTNVDNSCTAINNAGTVNLNGGTVYSNIITQGCTYMVVWSSIANARGIINSGTVNLNSGAITTNADAYMARPSGATVWGETYAYSYGIENSGTVNQNGSVTFTTTVDAHSGGTFTNDSDSADIKE